jgi:hypothetical protein
LQNSIYNLGLRKNYSIRLTAFAFGTMAFTGTATMRESRRVLPLLLISLVSFMLFGVVNGSGGVCFMFYLMADNDLESFLREDIQELMRSSAIRDTSLTTWAYIDQRDNYGSPLANIYNKDDRNSPANNGNKFSKTMYLNYDHDFGQMVVAGQSSEELNSDDYQTVYNFLTYALQDCVAKGSTEFMAVFSSHGAGFYGFGGDENKRRRALLEQGQDERERTRRRKMAQSNSDIALAIQLALEDNSLSQLDVLGFDACDMSSYVAAQQYSGVAKHYLASEATIPGHGWFFDTLKDVSSAVNIAKDLQSNFLSQKNKFWFHETPKTLALTDLTLFRTSFFVKMEALASHMANLLQYSQDVDFFAFLQRARAAAISFDSTLDLPGSKNPSAVDIGSFLDQLDQQCHPTADSEIRALLDDTKSAYDEMFVVRGVGPGTKPGTGMHFSFPSKQTYMSDTYAITELLLKDESTVTTSSSFAKTAPQWAAFLNAFYTTTTPTRTGNNNSNNETATDVTESVCSNVASSTGATAGEFQDSDRLLLNPSYEEAILFGDSISMQSELAIRTDAVTVDYGLMFAVPSASNDNNNDNGESTSTEDSLSSSASESAVDPDDPFRRKQRQLQQQTSQQGNGNNFMILYSGTVEGKYDGSLYQATWDATFIELVERETGSKSRSYVVGEADGDMSIPVLYFPDGVTMDWADNNDKDIISIETATKDLGGQYAELSFGLSDVMENDPNSATNVMTSWWDAVMGGDNNDEDGEEGTIASTSSKNHTWLSLYGQGDDGSNVKRAIPRSENGPEMIVPIMFYTLHEQQPDGAEDDMRVTSVTSLESVAFSWTAQSSLQPIPVTMADYVLDQKADAAVLEMVAVDYDLLESDTPERAKDVEQFIFAATDFEDDDFFDFFDGIFSSGGSVLFSTKTWCLGLQVTACIASSLFL